MRTVDPAWQNLAAGQRRARQLEIELRERWSARVEEAYHRAFERETAAWNEQRDAERHRYERALNGWHADRQREIKAGLIARDRAAIAERRQLARLLLLGFVVVLGGFLVPLMLSTPTMVATMVAVALLPLAFRLAAKSRARLRALREEDPSIPHGNQPKPQPRSCGSEPKKMARSPVSLDIVQRWWAEVSSTSTTAQGQVTYGDEGVEDFLCLLRHRLGDRYLVVRELPVARSLDVDMLVVGPTGVWVFEVKHWSGTIICRDGRWSRARTYHKRGGYPVEAKEDIDNFDEQWQREARAVKETLRRHLPQREKLWTDIGGGLVFTHEAAVCNIDRSCASRFGRPGHWAGVIANSPKRPHLTLQVNLELLDALITWGHRIDDSLSRRVRCSVELAQRLFAVATAEAHAYVADNS